MNTYTTHVIKAGGTEENAMFTQTGYDKPDGTQIGKVCESLLSCT